MTSTTASPCRAPSKYRSSRMTWAIPESGGRSAVRCDIGPELLVTSRARRERIAREVAMAVRRHLDIVLDADAAERHEPLDRGAIQPRLVLREQRAQQRGDEVETGLDRGDDARLQRARQAQIRVRPGRLALLTRLVGEMPARVVHLKTEQVAEA